MLPEQTTVPQPEPAQSVTAEVKMWNDRILAAKRKAEPDFTRRRADEEFVYGLQWPQQEDLNDERYIANIVMREVNQAVAQLYARNPRAVAKPRQRMEYVLWDEHPETLMQAAQALTSGSPDPMAMAVVQDFMQGQQQKALIAGLCKTLETWYKVQIDRQEPNFKLQMKQLVRRTKVCGCGYIRISFKREERFSLEPSQTAVPIPNRIKRIADLVDQHARGLFDENSAKIEELKLLLNSVQYSMANPTEARESTERLVFDFPPSTSIIVDPKCRMLKGFVGASWIVQEFLMPLDEARAFFEKPDLQVGSDYAKNYTASGTDTLQMEMFKAEGQKEESHVAVWEVFDKQTRSRFFMCDGYKDYLLEPEEPKPCVQRFWPILPLTFNDTETEPYARASIYPPSDVRLMRSAQLEWNNCGQRLKEHRRSNRPKYLTGAGWLTDEDKLVLKGNTPVGSVIEIKGAPPGDDINKKLTPFQHAAIDPALYTTEPLQRDFLLTTGSQQANLGPITSRGTATEASISEQSKVTAVSSNVDDLDELLTEMASVSGEMALREASVEQVKRDVGPGAVWPQTQREEYCDRVYLEVQAASSGRPNQAMEVAFMREIIPLLIQAGANPIFIVREIVKRWDDRLDVNEAFPVLPGMGPQPPAAGQGGPRKAANGPVNQAQAGTPVPIPASSDAQSPNNAMT
jgi:hypothetical protein